MRLNIYATAKHNHAENYVAIRSGTTWTWSNSPSPMVFDFNNMREARKTLNKILGFAFRLGWGNQYKFRIK